MVVFKLLLRKGYLPFLYIKKEVIEVRNKQSVIGQKIAFSDVLKKQSIIDDLFNLGITEGKNLERLHDLDYQELKHLLVLERLKRS